jgi:hypothetical protein
MITPIMKNILTVLLLATGLSTVAAAQEPTKPGDLKAKATMCNTDAWALCIKAPCSKTPDANGLYPCQCLMQSGWNLGPNSCEERAMSLTSTYANNFNAYSATVSCPAKTTQWAWCYGAKCEPDPKDPSKAICKCPLQTSPAVILVNRELCTDPQKVCGMLWSAAFPAESQFANENFFSFMKEHGMIANPPAPACPAPLAN